MFQHHNKKSYKNLRRRSHLNFRLTTHFTALFFLFSFLVLVFIFGGKKIWGWMQKPETFPVTQFQIEGRLIHEAPQAVQKITASDMHGGFFSLDVSAVKAKLLSMPWIAEVSFRRVWPNTLVVQIDEHEALARFGKNGVLTTKGQIFYPDEKTIPDNLPVFSGPDNQAENLFHFYQILNALSKTLGLTVIVLNVNAENSWDLTLSNHIQVILGRIDALKRFQQFVLIYPKILATSKQSIALIDLRYPNGVAVQYAAK